jgi:hypothetical protein
LVCRHRRIDVGHLRPRGAGEAIQCCRLKQYPSPRRPAAVRYRRPENTSTNYGD